MIHIGNQTACWAATPREPFDYAVASGFDAFEWFPDKKPNGGWDESDLDGAQRFSLRETACGRGIRVSVHARWQANPLQPASHALFEKDLELARDLGAVLLNIHLYHEQGISAYVQAIRPLIRRTAEAGLQLAIENTPHHAPEDFNELFAQLRRLDSPAVGRVGMCLDLGHANLCAATRNDYLQFVDRLAPQVPIIHLHLHENYGDADTHLPLFTGPAGRNDSGIRGLLTRLRQRQFAGSIILEQWPHPPSLLNQARDRLLRLLDTFPGGTGDPPVPSGDPPDGKEATMASGDLPAEFRSAGVPPTGSPSVSLGGATGGETPPSPAAEDGRATVADDFARKLIEVDQHARSWREKLDSVRELLANATSLTAEHLVDLAVYLRFLGTGEIPCVEDGRHFRPAHHARIALQIQERLAALRTPEHAFILRKIYPWLPSTAREFQRAEPLTRIRDIAHRNDLPPELKQEIKRSLQNKLHRCAGPEDLATSTALLARITAPGTDYTPAFVEQFRIFHEELKEFFNARSLTERLQALLPAVNGHNARLIHQFLAERAQTNPAARIAPFHSLTELRRGLVDEAGQVPDLERPDFLLADIGLEDFAFAWLSGIVNDFGEAGAGAAWKTVLEILQLTLANLELSQVELEEGRVLQAELRAWEPLAPTDREQLLRLKATVLRVRRLAESYSDRIMAWFPPRARALGRALAVPETAIRIFGEAEIRGHLVFQLSKLTSSLLRRIREALHQPAWDVVVSGQATGRLTCAEHLNGSVSEPRIVLLPQAEGDEEIPAGITGLVLAHDLPHLSHLGVRARQAGVVLVVCEEAAQLEELKRFEGMIIALSASAEKVAWQPAAAAVAAATAPPPRAVRIPQVRLLPEPFCLPLEQALANRSGNKADGVRRLAELAQHPEAGFKTPPALVIPFGTLVAALQEVPKIEVEYRQLVNAVDASSDGLSAARQLRELIQQLPLPETILAGVTANFSRHVRLMVRSSANDEDLANLSGAGLYESVANVPPADVAPVVRAVWASLWTRRAVLSRQQAGLPQAQAHMAVLLQQMLVPDFSFILHTVNPINHRRGEAYAELVVGLGETLASAATRGNPYRLLCDGHSGAVTTLAFASFSDALWPDPDGGLRCGKVDYSRVSLSLEPAARAQLGRRLGALAQLVESAFHAPQDIEGIVKGEEIYLVQARPQQGLG
jgi:phosphoglucan,water dikinase